MSRFKEATKDQSFLRAGIMGVAGSGKTRTALRIADGIGGPVAVIDSERGRSRKYGRMHRFRVLELQPVEFTPEGYIAAINEAAGEGFQVLIIDSLTHAWLRLCEENDKLASSKFHNNTWSAWSVSSPRWRRLIDAITGYPGHVIVTMRVTTEWKTSERGGKTAPERVGTKPEVGKNAEYEFDLLLQLDTAHVATVIKDITGEFQDQVVDRPSEEFGRDLARWLADGRPLAEVRAQEERDRAVAEYRARATKLCARHGKDPDALTAYLCDWLESSGYIATESTEDDPVGAVALHYRTIPAEMREEAVAWCEGRREPGVSVRDAVAPGELPPGHGDAYEDALAN